MIGATIYRKADQLLLGAFGQVQDLAGYAAAVRLVDALNIIPVAVATLALPVLANLHRRPGAGAERADRFARDGFRFLAAVVLPLAALATAAGATIMRVTYGPAYQENAGPLAFDRPHPAGCAGLRAGSAQRIRGGRLRWRRGAEK